MTHVSEVDRLARERDAANAKARWLVNKAEFEQRRLTSDEQAEYDSLQDQYKDLERRHKRALGDLAQQRRVDRILGLPVEKRSQDDLDVLNLRRLHLNAELLDLAGKAEAENRNLTSEEEARFDELKTQFDDLTAEIGRVKLSAVR